MFRRLSSVTIHRFVIRSLPFPASLLPVYFMSTSAERKFDYDLVVIGGGSGGLATAKEAVKVSPGLKVAVFDYVTPTPHGTQWGLGGTCVNVGCIPKKLMHNAAQLGHNINDANEFGWSVTREGATHDWTKMSELITNYIRSLNFSYRTGLRSAGVQYINAECRFEDPHTVEWRGPGNKSGKATSERFVIAVGGRPTMGSVPGHELCLSSDDIFWKKDNPGKTLVIGAGYIACECAGFLHGLGNDVTMMVRDKFMRKFDEQVAGQIGEMMERRGIRFLMPAATLSFKSVNPLTPQEGATAAADGSFTWEEKGETCVLFPSGAMKKGDKWQIPKGPIKVEYTAGQETRTETFDTVLMATGRTGCTETLNLEKAGVTLHQTKILVDENEASTASHIFAIGDVATGIKHHGSKQEPTERPELTPVAIQAGQYLARRIYKKQGYPPMNYHMIPSTVFSPDEYGFVGLTQEEASRSPSLGGIGKENVEVFLSRFGNLEISPTHPHIPKQRSHTLTGNNLWLKQFLLKQKLWWPMVGFDDNERVVVKVRQASGVKRDREGAQVSVHVRSEEAKESVSGEVRSRSQDKSGNWVYEVKLDDGSVLQATGNELELAPELEEERAEVFMKANCLAKLVCDKSRNNQVVGFHFIGPNAGEVTQGFALAVAKGVTKQDFDDMVGIHPTAAEEFTVLTVTQSSGESFLKPAGCGGGSCG